MVKSTNYNYYFYCNYTLTVDCKFYKSGSIKYLINHLYIELNSSKDPDNLRILNRKNAKNIKTPLFRHSRKKILPLCNSLKLQLIIINPNFKFYLNNYFFTYTYQY